MSHAVLCDVCGLILGQEERYFSLNAWHGKGQHYPGNRRKPEGWDVKRRDDLEQLSADVCATCMSDRVNFSQLNPVKTKETLKQELKAANPNLSGLTLLRQTAGSVALWVKCDRCQKDCIDKHLQIASAWLTPHGEELTAELCEPCVNEMLQPIVRFQVTPAKQETHSTSGVS